MPRNSTFITGAILVERRACHIPLKSFVVVWGLFLFSFFILFLPDLALGEDIEIELLDRFGGESQKLLPLVDNWLSLRLEISGD